MSMVFDWRDVSDSRLRELAKDFSASEIGKQIGCSRNAVIGRCMRRKIPLAKNAGAITTQGIILRIREHEKAKKPGAAPVVARRRYAMKRAEQFGLPPAAEVLGVAQGATQQPAPIIAQPETSGITIMDLRDHHCRWPLWEAETQESAKRFCGESVRPGQVYCDHCRSLAYQPRRTDSLDKKLGILKFRRAA